MLSKLVSLGDKVSLMKVNTSLEQTTNVKPKTYVSQVYDIISDVKANIAMPIEGGKLITLSLYTKYDVCFYTVNGLYQCEAVIVDRFKEDNLFVLVIEILTELKKYQRREYFRLECAMDVKYYILSEEERIRKVDIDSVMEAGREFKSGIALDISGGGLRFTSAEKLPVRETICVTLELDNAGQPKVYSLMGTILSSEYGLKRPDIYEHRIEFDDIKKEIRETLIKYIFEEERKRRKREKG